MRLEPHGAAVVELLDRHLQRLSAGQDGPPAPMKGSRKLLASPRAHAEDVPVHHPGGLMPRTSPALIGAAMLFVMLLAALDAPTF